MGCPADSSARMLKVVDIVKRYHTPIGERTILDGISFEIGAARRLVCWAEMAPENRPL